MSPNRRTKRELFTGLAYCLGAVPFGAKGQLFGLLLLFYNQLLGLPAAAVSPSYSTRSGIHSSGNSPTRLAVAGDGGTRISMASQYH